jgi:hypothetical protein
MNLLSANEIKDIMNHPLVQFNKEKLSKKNKVDFSIHLSSAMKKKIETELHIHLSSLIPMRWIKGDTPPHKDKCDTPFTKSYLIYLTDSVGHLKIEEQSYPIRAGEAHIFDEGLEHLTINTGDSERLMIGPMSETGNRVGVAPSNGVVFFNDTTLNTGFAYITYIDSSNYGKITIFDIPPPEPVSNPNPFVYPGMYEILYSYPLADWTPPLGKIFGGWKFLNVEGFVPMDSNLSKIYMPGETYTFSSNCALIPNWIDAPRPRLSILHFSNNAQVYYKSHSLSTGSGGSGVRNSRLKKRKT